MQQPESGGGGGAVSAVGAAATVVGQVLPAVLPEIYLVMGIIRAFQQAHNGQFPSPEEVQKAYSAVTQSITDVWAGWQPSGR